MLLWNPDEGVQYLSKTAVSLCGINSLMFWIDLSMKSGEFLYILNLTAIKIP